MVIKKEISMEKIDQFKEQWESRYLSMHSGNHVNILPCDDKFVPIIFTCKFSGVTIDYYFSMNVSGMKI
jgi:hypothetical protein